MKPPQSLLLALAASRSIASPLQSINPRQSGPKWDTAPCTTPEVTDASIDQSKRWNAVDTEGGWTAAVESWTSGGGHGGLKFPQQISNFFHGPEQMFCGNEGARDGCGQYSVCNNVKAPAGMFILNSFVAVSSMNYNFYDSMSKAETAITTTMGKFASTFAPIDDMSAGLKLALDLVGLGFAIVAAPVWNSALKSVPFFKANPNTLGTVKDEINPMVSNGITIAKDTSIPSQVLSAQNDLNTNLAILVKIWTQTLDSFNANLFNGSDSNNKILHDMITDGKVLEAGFQEDQLLVQQSIEKAIYGYLIPQAWPLSNKDLHPFVVDAQAPCGTVNPLSQWIDDKDASPNFVCYNGNEYYLMSVSDLSASCTDGGDGMGTSCTDNTFYPLPGVSDLDGNNWGGVTRDDFVAGAVESFKANGNKNGWGPIDITNGDALNSVLENGIRAPGVMQIPVCTAPTAFSNWQNHKWHDSYPPLYPCN